MNVKVEKSVSGSVVIWLSGEMDALGCSEVRAEFENIVDGSATEMVRLNLRDVTFLDSSGIGAIVFLYKRLRASGRDMTIAQVKGQPRELMQLLRIDKAIAIDWGADHSAAVGIAS